VSQGPRVRPLATQEGAIAVERSPLVVERVRQALDRPHPTRHGETRGDQLARLAHWASLVATLALLLAMSRRQWFVQDDWVFADNSTQGGVDGLFESYDVHWVTATLAIFKATFEIFAFKSYLPYVVPPLLFHVVAGHLLWRLMRQTGAQAWVATSLAAAFLLCGTGPVIYLLAIETGGTGSLALGLALLLLVNHGDEDRRRDRLAIAVAVLSLPFSSVSQILIGVAALVVWLRRGWRAAVRLVSVPAAIYVVWFVLFARSAVERQSSAGALLKIPLFIWSGVVATVETSVVFKGTGVLAVVALVVWVVTHWDRRGSEAAAAFALAAGVVVFFTIAGPGRVATFARSGVIEDRYVYFTWAFALPLIGLALTQLSERWRWREAAAVALGLALVVHGLSGALDQTRNQERREANLKGLVLASARVVTTEPFLDDVLVDADSAPSLTAARLQRFQRRGDLPALPSLDPAQQVGVALPLQARFVPAPPEGVTGAPAIGAVTGAASEPEGSCTRITPDGNGRPEVTLVVTAHSVLGIRSARGGEATVVLHSRDDPDAVATADYDLASGSEAFLELVAGRGGWSILLPDAGPTLVCRN